MVNKQTNSVEYLEPSLHVTTKREVVLHRPSSNVHSIFLEGSEHILEPDKKTNFLYCPLVELVMQLVSNHLNNLKSCFQRE